jgi:ribosome-associated protein
MDIRKKQRAVVDALEDIKGRDIVVFNTERLSADFERVVIATGDSSRQVKALADNVLDKLKKLGSRVRGIEGGDGGEWVLVDLGDIVVHVMHPTARLTYNLEELWGGKPVQIKREPEPTLRVAPKPKAKPVAKPKPKAKAKAKAKPKTKARPVAKAKARAKPKAARKAAKPATRTKPKAPAKKKPAAKKKTAKKKA